MRSALFFKECGKVVKSIPFLVYLAVLLLFFLAQYEPDAVKIEKPRPGEESYGTKLSDDPEVIMPTAADSLYVEFLMNSYGAYPVGFYKKIRLDDAGRREMAGILSELTGTPADRFLTAAESFESVSSRPAAGGGSMTENADGSFTVGGTEDGSGAENPKTLSVPVRRDLTEEQFHALMHRADRLIGGGSYYGDAYLPRFGKVPKTYGDALKEYGDLVEKDGVTGAYARYFCDYLGVVLALFPVFPAVAAGLRDRRAGARELVYSRKISSAKLVLTRWAALSAVMFPPVLLLAACATAQIAGEYPGFSPDPWAFFRYSFGWLLPSLMVSSAVGTVLTELTDTPIAVAVQGLWWFFGLNAGSVQIDGGGYGWNLVPRHNTIGNTQAYLDNFAALLWNRVGYSVFALLLVGIAVWVFECKRRGRWNAHFGFRKAPGRRRVEPAA